MVGFKFSPEVKYSCQNVIWYIHQFFLVELIEAEITVGHIADNILKYIFFKENVWISINISQKLYRSVQLTISQHWLR